MSDPANPELTDKLVTPAMLSPHESLVVSQKRGLLAAVLGNPAFYPGIVDVYDISEDCRHPVLQVVDADRRSSATRAAWRPTATPSTRPRPATETLVAVDITNLVGAGAALDRAL